MFVRGKFANVPLATGQKEWTPLSILSVRKVTRGPRTVIIRWWWWWGWWERGER